MKRPAVAALLVVWLLLAGGCATPRVNGPGVAYEGHAYCLRGLLDVFSLGLNTVAEELRDEGLDAAVMSGGRWRALARNIEDAEAGGSFQGPLVLIGHSYGADNAIRLARKLTPAAVDVDLLVLLDASAPPRIPPNVRRCLHLYIPSTLGATLPGAMPGSPVAPEADNNRTEVFNEVVSTKTLGDRARHVNHFNIDASPVIRERVIREILDICPPRRVSPPTAFVAEPAGTREGT